MYLPKDKYCVYPRMVYRLTIVIPPPPLPPILDDRKSLSIAFLAISDQCATSILFKIFVHKMAAGGHFGWLKITFDSFFSDFFTKWLPVAILDDRKSDRIIFWLFSQNGFRWPFWITENHFRSHFSPFQINTQYEFDWCISDKVMACTSVGVRRRRRRRRRRWRRRRRNQKHNTPEIFKLRVYNYNTSQQVSMSVLFNLVWHWLFC